MWYLNQFWVHVPMVSPRDAVDAVDEQVCYNASIDVCKHFLIREIYYCVQCNNSF